MESQVCTWGSFFLPEYLAALSPLITDIMDTTVSAQALWVRDVSAKTQLYK